MAVVTNLCRARSVKISSGFLKSTSASGWLKAAVHICSVPTLLWRVRYPVIADSNLDPKAVFSRDLVTVWSRVTMAELPLAATVQTLGLWEHWSTFPIVNACRILIDAEETCLLSPVKLWVYSSVWSSTGKVHDEMQTGGKVLLLTFAEAS